MAASASKHLPRDAQVMQSILRDMGITDYEPRVVNQMLEFSYRYVTDVLDDAKVYSSHAGKRTIDSDDVRLSVQCKMDHTFTAPPPRELLMEVARQKNGQVLPLIKKFAGTRLPPDRYCLVAANCKLKSKRQRPVQQFQNSSSTIVPNMAMAPRKSLSGAGGQLSLVTMGMSRPAVTVVAKPANSNPTTPTVQIKTTSLVHSGSSSSSISAPKIMVQTKRKREDDDYDD